MRFIHVIIFLLICGCAVNKPEKTGLERSEGVLSAMEQSHEQVQKVTAQVDRVEASLSELMRKGQSDIKGAFEEYARNVNELDKQSKALLDNTTDLQKKSNDYLANWGSEQNEFQNSQLEELSAERREELNESHEDVFTAAGRTENQLKAFLTDIKEIRDYLDNDLTAAGISSVSSLSDDVLEESDELQDYLEDLEYALEDAIAQMARY